MAVLGFPIHYLDRRGGGSFRFVFSCLYIKARPKTLANSCTRLSLKQCGKWAMYGTTIYIPENQNSAHTARLVTKGLRYTSLCTPACTNAKDTKKKNTKPRKEKKKTYYVLRRKQNLTKHTKITREQTHQKTHTSKNTKKKRTHIRTKKKSQHTHPRAQTEYTPRTLPHLLRGILQASTPSHQTSRPASGTPGRTPAIARETSQHPPGQSAA